MLRRRLPVLVALVLAAVLVTAAAAYATFTSVGSATQAVSTQSLAPPTGVTTTLTSQCKANKAQQVTVSWTASTSSFVTGYTVQRNGTTITTLGATATATSYVDNGVGHSTSYTYTVLATYQQWSSGASASPITTC
jgi:hypothetical protein